MASHMEEVHKTKVFNPENDFKMEFYAKDKDPLRRVLREAVRIKQAEDLELGSGSISLMNSKLEYFTAAKTSVNFIWWDPPKPENESLHHILILPSCHS